MFIIHIVFIQGIKLQKTIYIAFCYVCPLKFFECFIFGQILWKFIRMDYKSIFTIIRVCRDFVAILLA